MNANVEKNPSCMRSITPHLICAGAADAIEFYKKAFGAEEMMRLPGPDGRLMHGSVRIGDSMVMLVDEVPEWGTLGPKSLKGSPVTIHLMVDDVDAIFAQAVDAGATVKMPVADMFWGDRYGLVVDPFGHVWSIATHVRDMTPDEIAAAGREAMAKGCAEATA
ncbi:VOC family protein [Methylocystis sp. L43]|jgi:PhnB protein|uniref:VOC family protein n=1 Tax=unclassified Methylocystis TaxID=2625913 RepID=UPI0018C2DA9B|nr:MULTISPECIES: VOC family protein [unclassified Methylocystis]MBG0796457.1 VOC family protein [Methylocystis sp. L43]MBG0804369.1 VOC family protein [Methylocystis sp. H15]